VTLLGWLRLAGTGIALVLLAMSAWILGAELARPDLDFLPAPSLAAGTAALSDRATTAAAIGRIRGALWVDAAITRATALRAALETDGPPAPAAMIEETRELAARAALHAPHEARAWLLMAAADAEREAFRQRVAAPLKMSYLTGPNEAALMPLRLIVATRSLAITDEELQILAEADVRAILTRKPELKPAITAAYRGASADGRRFLRSAVERVDPRLADSLLRSGQS